MTRWSPLGLALFLAAPLAAQNPPPRHVVHGVVFDSVAQAPLAGAVVQIAPRDATGPLYSATTDSSGHFRIADLPAGQFLIGFYHDALTALGLDAPLRAFDLAADTSVTIDLGVPSGAVVHALRCGGDSPTSRDGLLAGFVRNAEDHTALTGATVAVEWRAIALELSPVCAASRRAVHPPRDRARPSRPRGGDRGAGRGRGPAGCPAGRFVGRARPGESPGTREA